MSDGMEEEASAVEKPTVLTEAEIQRQRRNREAFGKALKEAMDERKAKGLPPIKMEYASIQGPLQPGDENLPPEERPSTSYLKSWGP